MPPKPDLRLVPLLVAVALVAGCQADRLVGVHVANASVTTIPTEEESQREAARLPPCPPAAAPDADWRSSRIRVEPAEMLAPADWRRSRLDDSTEMWMAPDTGSVLLIQRSNPRTFIEIGGIDGYTVVLGGSRCGGLLGGVSAPYRTVTFAPRNGSRQPVFVAQADLLTDRNQAMHFLAMGRGVEGLSRAMSALASLRLPGWGAARE